MCLQDWHSLLPNVCRVSFSHDYGKNEASVVLISNSVRGMSRTHARRLTSFDRFLFLCQTSNVDDCGCDHQS